MKGFDRKLLQVIDDYIADYGYEGFFEEFFPGVTMGELVVDMYNAGMLPDDLIEGFMSE